MYFWIYLLIFVLLYFFFDTATQRLFLLFKMDLEKSKSPNNKI